MSILGQILNFTISGLKLLGVILFLKQYFLGLKQQEIDKFTFHYVDLIKV